MRSACDDPSEEQYISLLTNSFLNVCNYKISESLLLPFGGAQTPPRVYHLVVLKHWPRVFESGQSRVKEFNPFGQYYNSKRTS